MAHRPAWLSLGTTCFLVKWDTLQFASCPASKIPVTSVISVVPMQEAGSTEMCRKWPGCWRGSMRQAEGQFREPIFSSKQPPVSRFSLEGSHCIC